MGRLSVFLDAPRVALVALEFLGFLIVGFTGIYYSTMGALVSPEEMGSATAGGQLTLTAGALVAPPAFGHLVDVAGYRTAWLLLAALGGVAAVLVALIFLAEPSPRRIPEDVPREGWQGERSSTGRGRDVGWRRVEARG